MGLSFGQTGTPMNFVQGASVSDLAALYKIIGGRYTSRGTGSSQLVCQIGGLNLTYDGTPGSETLTVTEARSLSNDTHQASQGFTVGTEFDLAMVQASDGGNEWTIYVRARSSTGTGFSSVGVGMTDSIGSGTYTAQSGTPYWGNNAAAVSGTFDIRDAFVGYFNGQGLQLDADLELFGQGAAPFQLNYITLVSAPAAIGTAAWDRRPGAAAALTVSGTTNVLGVTLQDGPLANIDTTQSSTFSTNLKARYHADSLIYTSAGRIVEIPDLSGNLAHAFQLTANNQGLRAVIFGKAYIVRDCISNAKHWATRMVAGTPSGPALAGAISIGHAGGFNSMVGRNTGNINHLFWTADNTDVNNNFFNPQMLASSDRFSLNFNGTVSTQSTNMYPSSNDGVQTLAWDGTNNASNIAFRVDGLTSTGSAQPGATARDATRYIYRILYSTGTGPMEISRTRELCLWNAAQSSNLATLEAELHSRHAIPIKRTVAVTMGASTDEGGTARSGKAWVAVMPRVNAAGIKMVNFAIGGQRAGQKRLAGLSGAFTAAFGDSVTNTDGGTAKFVAADNVGGQAYIYGTAGTWNGTGTLDSHSSITYSAVPWDQTGMSHIQQQTSDTTPSRLNAVAACLNQYPNAKRYLVVNVATSNDFTEGANAMTGKLGYESMKAIVAYIRTQVTGSGQLFVVVRMHQPSTTSNGNSAEILLYNAMLRAGRGADFNGLFDAAAVPQFSDYAGAASTGDTLIYDDGVHLGDLDTEVDGGGHGLVARGVQDAMLPATGGGMLARRRSRSRLTRSRN